MHRERQQVDLVAVAERTKIKLSLLEGLEREDLSHWPRGIFRRSYLRAYAGAVGLDAETLVREVLVRFPDPEEDMTTALAVVGAAPGRPPTRLRMLVDTAFEAIAGRRPSAAPAPGPLDASSGDMHGPASSPIDGSEAEAAVEHLGESELRLMPAGDVGWTSDEPAWTALHTVASDDAVPDEDGQSGWSPRAEGWTTGEFRDGAWASGDEALLAAADDRAEPECAPAAAAPIQASSFADHGPDVVGVAHLCTRLACARDLDDIQPILRDMVHTLDAIGLIVWAAGPDRQSLVPVLAAGYPDAVLARLPAVPHDSATALAEAFRSGTPCIVDGQEEETGAVTVPILTAWGCAGVLALELRDGVERQPLVQSCAAILAAQLAAVVGMAPRAEAMSA